MNWPGAFVLVALMACNLLILGTTAYAVFWLGHSGWWFLLAICLLASSGDAAARVSGRGERL